MTRTVIKSFKVNITNFLKWAFVNKDADGLIVSFLIADSIRFFINNLVVAVINPIIDSFFPKDYHEKAEQVLNVFNIIKIRFQLQYILYGIVRMLITLFIAYFLLKYVFKALNV